MADFGISLSANLAGGHEPVIGLGASMRLTLSVVRNGHKKYYRQLRPVETRAVPHANFCQYRSIQLTGHLTCIDQLPDQRCTLPQQLPRFPAARTIDREHASCRCCSCAAASCVNRFRPQRGRSAAPHSAAANALARGFAPSGGPPQCDNLQPLPSRLCRAGALLLTSASKE
jgi:hypothetical protein